MARTRVAPESAVSTEGMTYLQLISQDKETRKEEELKLVAQAAGLELNKVKYDLTVEIQRTTTQIAGLKRAVPYNAIAEFKAVKHLEELEARLEFVNSVKEERFSDAAI